MLLNVAGEQVLEINRPVLSSGLVEYNTKLSPNGSTHPLGYGLPQGPGCELQGRSLPLHQPRVAITVEDASAE